MATTDDRPEQPISLKHSATRDFRVEGVWCLRGYGGTYSSTSAVHRVAASAPRGHRRDPCIGASPNRGTVGLERQCCSRSLTGEQKGLPTPPDGSHWLKILAQSRHCDWTTHRCSDRLGSHQADLLDVHPADWMRGGCRQRKFHGVGGNQPMLPAASRMELQWRVSPSAHPSAHPTSHPALFRTLPRPQPPSAAGTASGLAVAAQRWHPSWGKARDAARRRIFCLLHMLPTLSHAVPS